MADLPQEPALDASIDSTSNSFSKQENGEQAFSELVQKIAHLEAQNIDMLSKIAQAKLSIDRLRLEKQCIQKCLLAAIPNSKSSKAPKKPHSVYVEESATSGVDSSDNESNTLSGMMRSSDPIHSSAFSANHF